MFFPVLLTMLALAAPGRAPEDAAREAALAWFDDAPRPSPGAPHPLGAPAAPPAIVVACDAHEAFFAAAQGQAEADAEARATYDDLVRQAAAHARACALAAQLGADEGDVLVMRRQRQGEAHFGLRLGGVRYFGKAQLGGSAQPWRERAWTQWASAQGLALPMLALDARERAVLTVWVPQNTVRPSDVRDGAERAALLRRIREIHTVLPERSGPRTPAEVGSSRGHVARLEALGVAGPLEPEDLRDRLEWIDAQLQALQPRDALVHGDVALPNIVSHAGDYYFLDWERAGWGDPMRDPGRLISHARWSNDALATYLEAYLGAVPTQAQLRHLALVVAAFDIDHYGNRRLAAPEAHPAVLTSARRVADGIAALPDMPPVRWSWPACVAVQR